MKPIDKLFNWYLSKNALPYWVVLLVDSLLIFVSGVFSYWLFHFTNILVLHRFDIIYTMLLDVLISWIGFRLFNTYYGIIRYSSFEDLLRVVYGNTTSLAIVLIIQYGLKKSGIDTLSILSYTETTFAFIIATMFMWGERVVVKAVFDVTATQGQATNVLIYGAMAGGVGLAKEIISQRPRKYMLRGFISHDKRAGHFRLLGKKVYNVESDFKPILRRDNIQGILVSPLRIEDFRQNQKLQNLLISENVKIYLAQNDKEVEVKDGHLQEEDFCNVVLHEVSVEDLLPRDVIVTNLDAVKKQLKGKNVLITGAAGSIGSELVRQVASYSPGLLLLIDQAETPSHDLRLMMDKEFPFVPSEVILVSVCNYERMEKLFRKNHIDVLFHAAAYKHVPVLEDNPSEAVTNNILGTKVVADLSVKYNVNKFVMISTDKAVNPTNVMGCSKRICEIYVQSLNKVQNKCQFVTTRFGNVLGSNGSVIPLFEKQIKEGGPVTVTDERIVRYFMLIPEACKLVLEAAAHGKGGEIFAFDMGEPVKIANLARRMIKLSNASNVDIEYVGLRPGEKLYEEVLNNEENTIPSFHEKIRIAIVREYDFNQVGKEIDELIKLSKMSDDMIIVRKMKDIVPEYKSENSRYKQLDIDLKDFK